MVTVMVTAMVTVMIIASMASMASSRCVKDVVGSARDTTCNCSGRKIVPQKFLNALWAGRCVNGDAVVPVVPKVSTAMVAVVVTMTRDLASQYEIAYA